MSTLRNVFKIPELRNKLLFTLLMIAVYRLGRPHPGARHRPRARSRRSRTADSSGVLSLLQTFSGGAITQFAVFALGIMPYITASIIMQILAVVIPKLEQWQEQGAVGQRKITQWTRYLGVAIALLQGTGITYLFHTGGGGFGSQVNTGGLDVFGDNYNAGPLRPRGAHAHHRLRPPHVDRRDHHPARRRQRHVAAHLLVRGQPAAQQLPHRAAGEEHADDDRCGPDVHRC